MEWKRIGLLCAVGLWPVSAQTLHEDDKGGSSQTVSIYTRSRTHIDGGLLQSAGLKNPDDGQPWIVTPQEIWQHGHEGPRILRVILPEWKSTFRSKYFKGLDLLDGDIIEIDVVRQNGAVVGKVTLARVTKRDAGILTSGHTELVEGSDQRACYSSCPVCGPAGASESGALRARECSKLVDNVRKKLQGTAASIPDEVQKVWVFKADNNDLTWVPKPPYNEESIRQVILSKVPTPLRFDFALRYKGDPEDIAMKELRVMRNGGSVLTTAMPKFSRFQVCGADETTNKPLCDPLPECDTFWRRHFNKSCKIYGGTGVLTGYDPKKHKTHRH